MIQIQKQFLPQKFRKKEFIIKKGVLVEGMCWKSGDVVKIYGDGRMTYSMPGQYPGVTKMKRVRRASLEEAEEYKKIIQEALQ